MLDTKGHGSSPPRGSVKRPKGPWTGRQWLWLAVLVAVVAVAAYGWQRSLVQAEERPQVGYTAPDFTLTDLKGKSWRLSSLRGKPVFLNFWATWCPPCQAEMPDIEALHRRYGKDVVILGVNLTTSETSPQSVAKFLAAHGYTFPVVLDKTGSVAQKYLVRFIPTSFFIDRKGIIRAMAVGAMDQATMLANLKKAM